MMEKMKFEYDAKDEARESLYGKVGVPFSSLRSEV